MKFERIAIIGLVAIGSIAFCLTWMNSISIKASSPSWERQFSMVPPWFKNGYGQAVFANNTIQPTSTGVVWLNPYPDLDQNYANFLASYWLDPRDTSICTISLNQCLDRFKDKQVIIVGRPKVLDDEFSPKASLRYQDENATVEVIRQ